MNIVRQVTFESANRKKDRSVSIRFTTDLEQSTEEFMEIDNILNSRGILYYSDRGELTQEEIDTLDEVDIEMQGKSKSQRMRSVMFLLWKQQGEKGNFKDFYSEKMESIITKMKDKLD